MENKKYEKNSDNIVDCKVVKIFDDYLIIKHEDKCFNCKASQISDYQVNLHSYFKLGHEYKFLKCKGNEFSYKKIRPKLLKKRHIPIPTISGWKNLEFSLQKELKKIKINN